MTITWLGHACMMITHNGYSVVLDPYAPGSVPGYAPVNVEANEVLCSHGHSDHNAVDCVSVTEAVSPFVITEIPTYHDDAQGAKRGESIIRVFEADGIRVAHMGDLGCPLTDEQAAILGRLDAVMMPVGGFYTVDAQQAKAELDKLDTGVIIPMHYRGADFGYEVLTGVELFTALYDPALVKTYDCCSIEVEKGADRQVALLSHKF